MDVNRFSSYCKARLYMRHVLASIILIRYPNANRCLGCWLYWTIALFLANGHLQSDVKTHCRQFILGICQAMMLFGDWEFRL